MAKSYNLKVFQNDGTTFRCGISQEKLKNDVTFRSQINGGLGECVLDLDIPFDRFEIDWAITFRDVVDIYCVDDENPRGRRIYRGFVSKYDPYLQESGAEGVRVTLLGLVSLLSFSYYKNGSNYTIRQGADPETLVRGVIDNFAAVYGSLITYTDDTTDAVGETVDITFTDQKWVDAIRKVRDTAGTDWWWKVDKDGLFWLKAKPGTPTHYFTVDKDIVAMTAPKDSEKVVNEVQVRRSGGSVTNYSDATSQTEFGVRTKIISDSGLMDETSADQRGNKEIADNKDEKVKASLTIGTEYDCESIEVGHTCKVRNYDKSNAFFSDNMLIVALTYTPDSVRVELEKVVSDLGGILAELAQSETSKTVTEAAPVGFVPYSGATDDVDLGSHDIITTGTGTFGTDGANAVVVIAGAKLVFDGV